MGGASLSSDVRLVGGSVVADKRQMRWEAGVLVVFKTIRRWTGFTTLHRSDEFSLVQQTLARVSRPRREFSEFASDQETLAAAEIVACWLGRPPADKQDLVDWVRRHTNWFTTDLLVLAQETVACIKTKSPLREMLTDPGGTVRVEWLEAVADLERRLEC